MGARRIINYGLAGILATALIVGVPKLAKAPLKNNEIVYSFYDEDFTKYLDMNTLPFENDIEKLKEETKLTLSKWRSEKFVNEYYNTYEGHFEKERTQAHIYQESAGKKNATSSKGAEGLMQLLKPTWEWHEPEKDFEKYAHNPLVNIDVGLKSLKWFENYCEKNCPFWDKIGEIGKIKIVSACYNGGQQALKDAGWDISKMSEETREYAAKVLWAYEKLRD